jgi:hypothetical protein
MDDRVKPMKRPAGYDPVVAQEILDRVSNGEMVSIICNDERMPERLVFYRWMNTREDLAHSYARARLAWADHWADRGGVASEPQRSAPS